MGLDRCVLSSLTGLVLGSRHNPAINRWAIFERPCGTRNSDTLNTYRWERENCAPGQLAYPAVVEGARDGSGCSLSRRTGEGQGEGHVVRITPPVRHLFLLRPLEREKKTANKCLPRAGHLPQCVRIADLERSIARHDIATSEDGSRTPAGFRPGLARRLPGLC